MLQEGEGGRKWTALDCSHAQQQTRVHVAEELV